MKIKVGMMWHDYGHFKTVVINGQEGTLTLGAGTDQALTAQALDNLLPIVARLIWDKLRLEGREVYQPSGKLTEKYLLERLQNIGTEERRMGGDRRKQ